jgi:hypothetical protein
MPVGATGAWRGAGLACGMTDTCGDIDSAQRLARKAGWRRIGIDGVESIDKAPLAEALSSELSIPMLDVGDYLHRNQGGYVDFVDYPALKAAVSNMPEFVLCGVCLREVLENLGVTLDGNIYVKRMSQGFWMDEETCVFPEGVDAAIESLANHRAMVSRHYDEQPEFAADFGDEDEPHLANEVMRYHDIHVPHEHADLVLELTEDRVE